MPFPAEPDSDGPSLFLIQDPALRAQILPLFSFDPSAPGERPLGHGTAFRIDPWGTCATAFHVIEDLLTVAGGEAVLRDDIRLAALEIEGSGYGRLPLPVDGWRPFSGMLSLTGIETSLVGAPRVRNITELAALSIGRSASAIGPITFLPLALRHWRPEAGVQVMAVGFAELDVDQREEGQGRAMRQYLYGSLATIIEVQPPDGRSGRPWPVFRVEADWPGGMSGGPVFNDAGKVVGIVSTGMVGGGIGTATYFSAWNLAEETFRSLDPSNPGVLRCWTAFDADERIVSYAPDRALLEPLMVAGQAVKISATTLNPQTGSYFLL